jgi:hemolysin-activating ACP:hemolysin acyltransferase
LQHRQVRCYFSEKGKLIGLITWAWLTSEVLQRICEEGHTPAQLHVSEWREGDILCVLDLVTVGDSLREILHEFKESNLAKGQRIAWINWRRKKLKIKQASQTSDSISDLEAK